MNITHTSSSVDGFGRDVIYVAPDLGWKGGISSVVAEYKQAIHPFQYQPSTTSENIQVTILSFPWLLMQFCFKLLVSHRHAKIVHIHGSSRGSFYRKYIFFLLASYVFRKKVVYHMHGGTFHVFYREASTFVQQRIRHFINTTDCLIVLSELWKDYYSKEFHPRMIRIVPNIVRATSPPHSRSHLILFDSYF